MPESKSNLNDSVSDLIDMSDITASNQKGSLKIVHVCMQEFGGAGKAAYRLHKGLQSIGVNSTMVVFSKKSDDPSIKVLPESFSGGNLSCLDVPAYESAIWRQAWARWDDISKFYPDRPAGLELFTDAESEVRLDFIKEIQEADIINLHWVAGMLNYPKLPQMFRNKHIVWTLHDMNPFTGGCHYSGDCLKYTQSCEACPQLGSNTTEDLSRQVWKQKLDAYKDININVVTPSRWLGKCAYESTLFSQFPINVIPYGFPLDVFKPYPKAEVLKALNVSPSAKIILFGAACIVNQRKGFRYLLDAIEKLSLKDDQENIIFTFGTLPQGVNINSKYPIYSLGSIVDENKLAMIYSAADVFVIPSLEDNLPNTVVEAMACGVPVVGFDIGGIPDMIDHKKTGYLVPPKDTIALAEGIEWVLSSYARGENLSAQCRQKAVNQYALEIQATNYKALYTRLLQSKKSQYIVSAIVSTYNAERFIYGCLEDLVNQTLCKKGKLEIVVVNSGSQQNEEAIVLEFQSRYDNIKYIRTEERETIYKAWNRAIKVAAGKYITNANTDDRHAPHMLERLAVELEKNEDIAAVYSHFYVTTVENQTWETKTPDRVSTWNPPYSREGLLERYFLGPQPMWRKSLHDEYGYFDDSCKVGGDYEFFLRASQTHDFLLIPEPLGLYLLSDNSLERSATTNQECQWIQNLYRNNTDRIVRKPFLPSEIKTTAFILTVGDPAFEYCKKAIARQTNQNFKVNIIQNVSPLSAADQEMINRCDTEYFIKVDEDMILHPDAVEKMQAVMDAAPDNIGMVCFFLYDEDRESNIQGIKIFRTSDVKDLRMQNIRANDMDLTEQMGQKGIKWVAHPDVVGRHGTIYTPETIYRRYKAMYEDNISVWNCLQSDMRKKADKYHRTGNPLELFALLGAAHGIINIPHIKECQGKDAKEYCLKELDTFKRLLLADPPACMPYEPGKKGKVFLNEPLNFEQVQWKKTPTPKNNSKSTSYLKPPARKAAKSLSILHTVEFYYPQVGGAEIVVQELSERLVKRGHRVTVATTKLADRTFAELNGVQIEEFDVRGAIARGFTGSDIARYQQFLLKHPADIMMNYAAQQWATDLAFDTLASTSNRRVNIIAPCGYSALSDSKTLQMPQFADYFNIVIPAYLPKYDAVVYHSRRYQDYEFAQNHGFNNSVIIPNGVCEEEFSQTPKVAFRQKYKIATKYLGLCVANFYSGKGQDRVIECVRQMNRTDFTMVFIGKEGGQLANLQTLATGLNIRFCTDIDRQDVLAAYHEADIFLFGSEKECSPLVIVEAKASRTPFVSTDCGNIREWKGGVVCAPEKMAVYANRILDEEIIHRSFAEDGWMEWKEKLTWGSVIGRYEQLYSRLYFKKFRRIDIGAKDNSVTQTAKQLQEALNAKQVAGAKGFV